MTHPHEVDQFKESLEYLKSAPDDTLALFDQLKAFESLNNQNIITSSEVFDVTAKINIYRGIEVNRKDRFIIKTGNIIPIDLKGQFAFLIDENFKFKGYFKIEKGESDGHYFLTASADMFLREQKFPKDCFLLVRSDSKEAYAKFLKNKGENENADESLEKGIGESFFDSLASAIIDIPGNLKDLIFFKQSQNMQKQSDISLRNL